MKGTLGMSEPSSPVTDAAPALPEETLALLVAHEQRCALAFSSKLTSKDSQPFSPWPQPPAAAAHSGKMELQPHFLVSFQHGPAFPQPPSFFFFFFFALDLLVLICEPYFL